MNQHHSTCEGVNARRCLLSQLISSRQWFLADCWSQALWSEQVCVMRLPAEMLQEHLAAILEGILLWSEDSKNKFRLKVGWTLCLLPKQQTIVFDYRFSAVNIVSLAQKYTVIKLPVDESPSSCSGMTDRSCQDGSVLSQFSRKKGRTSLVLQPRPTLHTRSL